jgi:DNA repair protein RadA/Sms
VFGEVGLAGEIRAVDMARRRVSEAAKFGFESVLLPRGCADDMAQDGVELTPVSGIAQAVEFALER